MKMIRKTVFYSRSRSYCWSSIRSQNEGWNTPTMFVHDCLWISESWSSSIELSRCWFTGFTGEYRS